MSVFEILSSERGSRFVGSMAAIATIIWIAGQAYRTWNTGGREYWLGELAGWYTYLRRKLAAPGPYMGDVGAVSLILGTFGSFAFMFGLCSAVVASAIVSGLGVWDAQSAGDLFFYIGCLGGLGFFAMTLAIDAATPPRPGEKGEWVIN